MVAVVLGFIVKNVPEWKYWFCVYEYIPELVHMCVCVHMCLCAYLKARGQPQIVFFRIAIYLVFETRSLSETKGLPINLDWLLVSEPQEFSSLCFSSTRIRSASCHHALFGRRGKLNSSNAYVVNTL